MQAPESSTHKIKLKIQKPEDSMSVDPPVTEPPKPGSKNSGTSKKNAGTNRVKNNPDEMDVDGPEFEEESKPAGKNASGKSRAARPSGSGDQAASRKNKRNKANPPPTAVSVAPLSSTALPEAPLAASTTDLDMMAEGSLEEGEDGDAAYGSDSEEGKKKSKKNSKKNKPKARNPRNKPPKDTTVTDFDVSLLDENDHNAGYQYASQLWDNVKAYFAEFTQEDIDSVTPKENPVDNSMSIPRLGPHWASNPSPLDPSGRPNPRRMSSTLDQSGDSMMTAGIHFDTNDRPETLSSRILAALVEDHNILTDQFILDDMNLDQQAELNADLVQDPDSNLQQQELIDQRVRYELRAVGLLEDSDLVDNPREDDEICAELRTLQQQLKQQVSVNNRLKARLHEKVHVAMEQRREQKKRRDNWLKQEKELLELLKTKYPRPDKEKDKDKKGK